MTFGEGSYFIRLYCLTKEQQWWWGYILTAQNKWNVVMWACHDTVNVSGSVSGFHRDALFQKKSPSFFFSCAVDGGEKTTTKKTKQFPLAAYWFGLRHIRVMVLCWQWLWRYLSAALSSYTTLSSGHRRLLVGEKVISRNDFVFTDVHVEACSGNQPL